MTVRAINTASGAEIALCVTNWNAQAALINTPAERVFDIWTPEACRMFLSTAFAHRIDDTNNTFIIASVDPVVGSDFEFVGVLRSLLGVARCMRALCQLLPAESIIRGDVSVRGSQTIKQYFGTRYTANQHPSLAGVTRYLSTAANIVGVA